MFEDDDYELNWLDLVLYYGYQFVPIQEKEGCQDDVHRREDRRAKRVHKLLRMLRPGQDVEESMREFALIVAGYFHKIPEYQQAFVSDELWASLGRFNKLKPDTLIQTTNAFLQRNGAVLEMKPSPTGAPQLGIAATLTNSLLVEPFMRFTTSEPQWLYQCRRCGLPYHPQRSDSWLCGATCRSGERRDRKNG